MLNKSSFKNQFELLVPAPYQHTYLLAVSGGADSMVLLNLFFSFFSSNDGGILPFQVAHINYKLRGEDSDSDQKTVEDFCQQHSIPFHLYEVSEKDQQPDHSIQLWARELRYNFFKEIQKKESLNYLVTAHHLNDQLETFLIHLSKASGIKGLSGIPANENNIIRPLLSFSKEEIYQYARYANIEFREDLSNKKSDYLRNKIRNEIVPKLLETNDHFLENFKRSSSYLNQAKDFIEKQIRDIENKISMFHENEKVLDKEKLSHESDFVKFEILKKYGFNKEEEIAKIFKAETGSSFFSKEFQLVINRNHIIITENNFSPAPEDEITVMEDFDFSQGQIKLNLKDFIEISPETDRNMDWYFNAEKLHFPLKLRKKITGDFFYPSGFSGKKKVSKFFKDEKLSILAKQKIWLLTDGDNSVLGIIPLRQDRRYTRDEETNFVLQIFNEKKHEI
ncbi:tRNA lysidine(34) synthetase TilS [Chryseobacterium sp. CT-SW4]|uniref:tRNA lysidine(34) synthetase TilS n=1 Tax=Chryseobacterium sp. SW-1 TaxID=3157343 RepID=UPI003B02A935